MLGSLECDSEIDEEELDKVWWKTHCHTCNARFPHYGCTGTFWRNHRHAECKSVKKRDLCWNCFSGELAGPKPATLGLFPDCDECDMITLEKAREQVREYLESRAVLLLATKFSTFQ